MEKWKGTSSISTSSPTLCSPKKAKIKALFDTGITGLDPFSFLERDSIRKHVKYPPISIGSLLKYMYKRI